MNWKLKSAIGVGALLVAAQAAAQITFYEGQGFGGRSFSTDRPIRNFERQGFNDRASSAVVDAGRWEVCEDPRFEGRCVVLRRGSYDSLRAIGLNNRISSVRPVDRDRAAGGYGDPRYREATITSVRAVTAEPQQHCWTERQPAYQSRGDDVGEMIAGAIFSQITGDNEREVQRCERVTSGAPQNWEVTYRFRGVERRALLDERPAGRTLTVDDDGNPIG